MPTNTWIPVIDKSATAARRAALGQLGGLGDPDSDGWNLGGEREGYNLMPERESKPTTKYLPPRPRRPDAARAGALPQLSPVAIAAGDGLLGWVDRLLSS